jgi:hypothetical protein
MRNSLALLCMCSISIFTFGQEVDGQYIDRGLFRMQGNLSFAKSLTSASTNMYLTGDLDYFIDRKISVRGAANYFIGSFGRQELFDQKHTGFAGFSYHIGTSGNIDPYVGLMPGFAFSRLTAEGAGITEGGPVAATLSWTFNPLLSAHVGVNYYASKYFNFFVHLQYVTGSHFSNVPAVAMDELAVSFGLGYMLWARNGRVSFRKAV